MASPNTHPFPATGNPALDAALSTMSSTGLFSGLTATSLILGILFSGLGAIYIRMGKHKQHTSMWLAGLGLVIYPWFVYRTWPLALIGIGLAAVPMVIG